MWNNKWIIPLFILVCLVQLAIPAKMIFVNDDVLESGIAFKFKTAPIDPNDPFRGKYVFLQYTNNEVVVDSVHNWNYNQDVYVILKENSQGFAVIESLSKTKPEADKNFVLGKIENILRDNVHKVFINYPFDRYYMDEFKAPEAEKVYAEAQIDTSSVAYALVMVKNGNAVIKNVFIDDKPILQVVEENRKKSSQDNQ